MKMHMLSGGRVMMRESTDFLGTDRSELIELPLTCVLMRHAQGNVLFDTGCHPGVAEKPEPRLRGRSKFMIQAGQQRRVSAGADALNMRENLDRDIIPRNTWNAERCAQSFAEIRRIEASSAKIICGHDAARSLCKGLDAYE